jgi:hypothetical protein
MHHIEDDSVLFYFLCFQPKMYDCVKTINHSNISAVKIVSKFPAITAMELSSRWGIDTNIAEKRLLVLQLKS